MAYTGSYGTANNELKLGIWYRTTDNGTTYTVEIEIWFNSGTRNVEDSSNSLYFDRNATSATTYKTGFNIDTTSKKEIKLVTYTYTYTKKKTAQTINCAAKLTDLGGDDRTVSVTNSFTVPALSTYTVKYDANGGTGAPSSQTKTYGTALTLSSTKPTRTGYTFKGWGTSASATTVAYAAGASYTANAAITLYAIWTPNTYTVSYNANGGSGAPSSQTKTQDVALTLSSVVPIRTGYTFKGWGTSASATTVAYAAGASYTDNAAITLYAIWELAANCYVKQNGTYLPGMMYVKESGTYKLCSVYVKDGEAYKQGGLS